MANIGYRTLNGTTDLVQVALGNLASQNSVPETWIWAGRLLNASVDAEIVSSPAFTPTDFYIIGGSGKYAFYDDNGAQNATDGPTTSTTVDAIVVLRRGSGTAARWSIATHNGSVWSSFTHTNSAVTFTNSTYSASGDLEVGGNAAKLNCRYALLARCSTALSDGDVATLTTSLASWQAIGSMTNLLRLDRTPLVDLEGTWSQTTLTGTSVTAGGFPLDDGVKSLLAPRRRQLFQRGLITTSR